LTQLINNIIDVNHKIDADAAGCLQFTHETMHNVITSIL